MFSKLSVLIYFCFLLLNFNLTVRCKPNTNNYLQYLLDVLIHVNNQPGWSSKEHLYIKLGNDQLFSVYEYVHTPTTLDTYMIKLKMFTRFINCRYTEILCTFSDLLEECLAESNEFLHNDRAEDRIYYASQFRILIEQCKYFFEKLSAAMSFIDQLDLRFIVDDEEKPITMADMIKGYLRFFQWKKTQPLFTDVDIGAHALKEHDDLRRFLANNFKPRVMTHMKNVLRVCVFKENTDLVSDKDQVNPHLFVQGFIAKLVEFIHRIVNKEFKQMGFERLTNSNISGYGVFIIFYSINFIKFIDKY